jgi:tetratricopeptide (TPR) repeat protein
VALAATGDATGAEAEGEAIARLAAHADFADLATKGVPAAEVAAISRHVVAGRVAQARGRHDEAAAAFREAAAIQDRLPYMEPPFWYYPVRQSLGGALLAAGRPEEAADAFRDSLLRTPNNAYALFGLAAALRAAGDAAGAAAAETRFRAAWSGEAMPELGAL